MSKTIRKKIWPDKFNFDLELNIDFRCADFDVEPGDTIIFQEWDLANNEYTGREFVKVVKQVIKCESPTRYWSVEQLERSGLFLLQYEKGGPDEPGEGKAETDSDC